MLDLEAWDNEGACAVGAEDERDRPLGRREREAGVVEDVVGIEEDDAGEAVCAHALEQLVAACSVLFRCDRDRRHHERGA
jgi:hypothetical protein